MGRAYKNASGEVQVEMPIRTGADPAGGVLLGLDHLSLPELAADVAAPPSTRGRLYVKDSSGRTKVFLRDSTGVARLLDENDVLTPAGPAGGDLAGTYPNPTIAPNAVTSAKASTGTGSTQLAAGDDARFPTAGQKNALAGTDGTPGTGNEYLTKSGVGSRVQAWDADLDAIATLTTLAFGRGLMELANAAAVQSYIGLGTAATKDAAAAGSVGKVLNADDPTTTNARAPTAHAASHQPGGGDAMAVDAAVGTGSLRTIGTGAQAAAAGADLVSALGVPRHVLSGILLFTTAAVGGSQYALGRTNQSNPLAASAITSAPGDQLSIWNLLDPALYPTIAGKAPKLRIKAAVMGPTTNPVVTITFGLYPITPSGGSWAIGAQVAGSTLALVVNAANADAHDKVDGIALPGAGRYIIIASPNQAPASSVPVFGDLEIYYA